MATQPQPGSTKPKTEIAHYMAARRANLIAANLCCDCGQNPPSTQPPLHSARKKDHKHVLCDACLEARRQREKNRQAILRRRGDRWGIKC